MRIDSEIVFVYCYYLFCYDYRLVGKEVPGSGYLEDGIGRGRVARHLKKYLFESPAGIISHFQLPIENDNFCN